ncbi:uncharacterized protein N7483_002460 [Penicillium malachiteum]|uniref:uncharacterized protein n=1 Tax=Penicillium malachiteum TaxID=1324776 RepID=UPI002548D8D8|nr:uncharacterized protein N7483_002460 [Penicillium malachiteum]KAJ5737335.1 hypothetical protein N7483_002460 [Penicillium malachiteum]
MSIHHGNEAFEVQSWCSDYEGTGSFQTRSTASTEAAGELSETSEDLWYVMSDGEPSRSASSASGLSGTNHLPSVEQDGSYSNEVGRKWPVNTIAKRLVNEDGHLVEQYLVLWCSWERRMPAMIRSQQE